MNRQSPVFLCLLLGLLALSCRSEKDNFAQPVASQGITDALGRVVMVDKPIERVLTIAPGATEVVVAAGGLDKLVATSNVDTLPPEVLSLSRFSVLPMDFEAITSLDPDLVFASSQVNDPQHVKVFESLGIPVFFLAGDSWEEVAQSITNAGVLLGTGETAEKKRLELEGRIEHLTSLTSTLTSRPRAIFLISDVTSYSFGPGSYVQDLLAWAGLESLTRSLETPNPVLTDEWVLIQDPDVIFGTFAEGFQPHDLLIHHPTWKNLKAIQTEAVYSVPNYEILRPGPSNVDAAYRMARLVHPELFDTELDPR